MSMMAKVLSRAQAETYFQKRLRGEDYEPTTDEVGQGRKQWETALTAYRAAIDKLLNDYSDRTGAAAKYELDSVAAEKIHRALDPLSDDIAGDDGFWRYLALHETWDLVVWRHGKEIEGELTVGKGNVGLGSSFNCLPRRLWLRAEVSIDPDPETEDRYALSRRGSVDFWASGPTRHLFGGYRLLARALIRFQYPKEGEWVGTSYQPSMLTLNGYRELFKRIRHFQAILSLSALDEAATQELLKELAEDLERT